jgi:hypothetical protein
MYTKLFLLLCVLCYFTRVHSVCPYTDTTLKAWSNPASWPSGQVPVANSDVVIPAGRNIVLDVSPPALKSLIVDGGKFVWGNFNNLEVVTGALIAKNGGEIWVGSEDCLFTKKAYITLTGSSSSPTIAGGFGNKVLGVGAKGTLELHGTKFVSWTRLGVTHKPVNYKNQNFGRGVSVGVFDPTSGSLLDFRTFDTYLSQNNSNALTTFLNSQASGRVVTAVCADECSRFLTPAAKTALQSIGSAKITQVLYRSGWACIGVKGSAIGSAVEDLKNETQRPTTVVSRTFSSFTVTAQANAPYGGFIQVVPGGTPTITLASDVNWQVGQQIVVASSDQDYNHAEQNEIVQVVSPRLLRLKNPLLFTHWGAIESGVDERAEVGLLSRSIVVRGRQVNSNDTYGGQSRFMVNFTNVHIENVEFFQMGQDGVVGSYPVHFHMAFDVDQVGKYTKPAYVKGNSIWKSYNRCVTIHGTSGLLVKDNVAYDHKGHCYFFEDGSEMRNTLDGNLGLSTRYGNTILTDYDPARCTGVLSGFCNGPATYWLTNPNNTLINNVAAGSVRFGIWYVFPSKPTGLSAPHFPNLAIPFIPMGPFRNNVAHSSNIGLMVDSGIVSTPGPTYLGIQGARYRPHLLPTLNSPRVIAWFNDSTLHHCKERGAWLRGGDFRMNNFKFADNQISVTLASEGTMPNDNGSSQEVYNSLFVGITNNNYSAILNARMYGFEFYDGPVRCVGCKFVNFPNTNRNSSAISFKLNNVWQMATTSEIRGATFTNVHQRVFFQKPVNDGDRNNFIWDSDGSLTGRVGWNLVTPLQIFHTKRCLTQPLWNAVTCPDKYGMLFIANLNKTNTNYTGGARLILHRDERSGFPMNLTGISGTPPERFQPNVLLNKTYTLHFAHPTPPQLSIQITNFNFKDWVRVGVCYPKDATLSVKYRRGNVRTTMTPVSSLAGVDSNTNGTSTYYFDSSTGLLFFKAIAQYGRNGLEYCGSGGCESVDIVATGPNVGKASGTCNAYPKYATTEP